MSYQFWNPAPSEKEEKDYYEKSERALRKMSKYDHPGHNDRYYQPGGNGDDGSNNDGCRLFALALIATPISLLIWGISHFL